MIFRFLVFRFLVCVCVCVCVLAPFSSLLVTVVVFHNTNTIMLKQHVLKAKAQKMHTTYNISTQFTTTMIVYIYSLHQQVTA